MSLIVSVFINGAIVMASDSRASMSRTMVNGNQTVVDNFIHYNDTANYSKHHKNVVKCPFFVVKWMHLI